MKARSALKVKNSAMPDKDEGLDGDAAHACEQEQDDGRREREQKRVGANEKLAGEGHEPEPVAMASAAPKLAADEMPSVKGSASGLLRMVCICAPATPSIAPTSTAMTATGKPHIPDDHVDLRALRTGIEDRAQHLRQAEIAGADGHIGQRSATSNIASAATTIASLAKRAAPIAHACPAPIVSSAIGRSFGNGAGH